MTAEIMDLMIGGTEMYITENIDKWGFLRTFHKSTRKSQMRVSLVAQFNQILETIIGLKESEYYEKYANIRKVQSCEILDNTFFKEYYQENRLTHLKPLQTWSTTLSRNSKKS